MQRISKDDPCIEFMLFLYYDGIFCVIMNERIERCKKKYTIAHMKRKTWKAGML